MNKPSSGKSAIFAPKLALLALSGKHTGKEFPLTPDKPLIIGRSRHADISVEDDLISRRHTQIAFQADEFVIEDMGSVNGTFLNRQKVTKAALKEGDQIRVGGSNFNVISLLPVSPLAQAWWDKTQATMATQPSLAGGAQGTPELLTNAAAFSISGSIKEISLVELIQLLSNSCKSGVIRARTSHDAGKIFLKTGRIYHASINDHTAPQPEKTVYRILRWNEGTFSFTPNEEHLGETLIADSTQALLMEGVRLADELSAFESQLPQVSAKLALAKPLPGLLRDLTPDELDLCQLVHERCVMLDVLDHFPGNDLDASQHLHDLLERGFILVADAAK